MSPSELRSTAREFANQLARGDYDLLIARCVRSRLTSNELRSVIRDYGRKLISPPKDAYNNLDAVEINGAVMPTWSIRAPLWTEEEGRSDLTLEFTIADGPIGPSVKIDDLHVL